MANSDDDMTAEEVRGALIAKIEAIYPQYKDHPDLVRTVDLGSNDDLRRYLALAEVTATMSASDASRRP